MLEAIKQVVLGVNEASNQVAIFYGTVTSDKPLEINVDQRFTLTEEFLVIPERLTLYEVDLSHTHAYTDVTPIGTENKHTSVALPEKLIIRRAFKVGDTVLLMRVQGGNSYVVLDRVVAT
ncbi:hypothetical protein AYJ08_20800 [Brevibacillus sp. SKDU10]|uniref:DUF2577 domain-containing protein n=1 Tax=Brevibacillus sp. SKDU10 TaxID=1247872 RepID=UPI0007C990CF|nr:DUF2577 domain-containing protein [Brevibacillus sp. SKDU10]OAJ75841.1 hypothetical protein AYJ08_20800 [Brevibacillus sp. SKDU10]